jgi:hypothetical protein
MSFNRLKVFAAIAVSLSVFGCGGGPADTKVSVSASAISASAKKTLEEFEKTGKLGSGITGLGSDINGIAAADSAKGEALQKLYRELQGLTKADEIKAKAKEMISKL